MPDPDHESRGVFRRKYWLASPAYAGALYGESAVLSCRTVRKLHSGNFSDSGTEKSLGEAIWLRFLYDGAGIDSD